MADDALYTYVTTTGVIVPDTADIKAGVQAEWKAALGDDLDVSDSSPQGVLIAAETAARRAVGENNAQLANQINPNLAGGVFLDAVCALTGLSRTAASRSTVAGVVVTGVPGTTIPAGAIAKTGAGDQFATAGAVTLPDSGAATAAFIAVETGPVPCPVGALTQIVTAVLGWESVNNPAAATLGTAQQTDAALRAKRRNTLAIQGISLAEAITSALYDVEGVTSLQFRENTGDAAATIDGIALAPHSVWACVHGGSDADVAAALLANKSGGCAWNGATASNVPDASSGQTYTVKFDRPAEVPIKARITVKITSTTVDAQTAVRAAVAAWATLADDGKPGLRTGGNVSPFDLAAAVNAAVAGVYVAKVELSTVAADSFAVSELVMALNQVPILSISAIAVVTA